MGCPLAGSPLPIRYARLRSSAAKPKALVQSTVFREWFRPPTRLWGSPMLGCSHGFQRRLNSIGQPGSGSAGGRPHFVDQAPPQCLMAAQGRPDRSAGGTSPGGGPCGPSDQALAPLPALFLRSPVSHCDPPRLSPPHSWRPQEASAAPEIGDISYVLEIS